MKIDIDKLSEDELIELNQRIFIIKRTFMSPIRMRKTALAFLLLGIISSEGLFIIADLVTKVSKSQNSNLK